MVMMAPETGDTMRMRPMESSETCMWSECNHLTHSARRRQQRCGDRNAEGGGQPRGLPFAGEDCAT